MERVVIAGSLRPYKCQIRFFKGIPSPIREKQFLPNTVCKLLRFRFHIQIRNNIVHQFSTVSDRATLRSIRHDDTFLVLFTILNFEDWKDTFFILPHYWTEMLISIDFLFKFSFLDACFLLKLLIMLDL